MDNVGQVYRDNWSKDRLRQIVFELVRHKVTRSTRMIPPELQRNEKLLSSSLPPWLCAHTRMKAYSGMRKNNSNILLSIWYMSYSWNYLQASILYFINHLTWFTSIGYSLFAYTLHAVFTKILSLQWYNSLCNLRPYSQSSMALFVCIPNFSKAVIRMFDSLSRDKEVITVLFPIYRFLSKN